jgi:hypothetical protein
MQAMRNTCSSTHANVEYSVTICKLMGKIAIKLNYMVKKIKKMIHLVKTR